MFLCLFIKILSEALIQCHKTSSEAGTPLQLQVFISGRNRLENPGAKCLAAAFEVRVGFIATGLVTTILSLQANQVTYQGRAYPGLFSVKRITEFPLPLDGMLAYCRITPSTQLCTWVERGTVIIKCLAQENNAMSLARTQTCTAWSRVKCPNLDVTAPPMWQWVMMIMKLDVRNRCTQNMKCMIQEELTTMLLFWGSTLVLWGTGSWSKKCPTEGWFTIICTWLHFKRYTVPCFGQSNVFWTPYSEKVH